MNNRWRAQVNVLLRMADADLRAGNRADTLAVAKAKFAGTVGKTLKALEIMRGEAETRRMRDARRAAKCRTEEPAPELPVIHIICDRQPENMPEEHELRPEPLTFREKFILGAIMIVTGLWVILLGKICGWVAVWVKGVL